MDITDRYIRVRMKEPSFFKDDSFRIINISVAQGVRAIVGRPKSIKATKVQAYLFEKKKSWTEDKAKTWVEEHDKNKSKSELLLNNRILVTSSIKLCDHLPNITMGKKDVAKLEAESKLNDKYYFFSEGVHEGPNLNKDYFFRDELTNNYLSVAHQPINWEHVQHQIIGHTVDAQLLSEPEKPLSIGFNGILWRLSPFLRTEENGTTRDEIVKSRFFEGKLAVSMEALFDRVKCVSCGFETDDAFEFEQHRYMAHKNQEAFRGLVGIDFVAFGIVETPADPDAEVISLRTSDEGVLEEIVTSEYKEKFGDLAENVTLARLLAKSPPNLCLENGKIVISKNIEKNIKNRTKIKNKHDKHKEQAKSLYSFIGGNIMFKLAEKVAMAKSLSDVFVISQEVLKDFMGENVLTEEEAQAFSTELSEIVQSKICDKYFKVDKIYTLSKEEKLDEITKVREEEKKKQEATKKEFDTILKAKQAEIDSAVATLTEKESIIASKDKEINSLKTAETEKEKEVKATKYVDDIVSAGLSLTDNMKARIKDMIKPVVNDEKALSELKSDLFSTVKKSNLAEASHIMGEGTVGSGPLSFEDELREIRKKDGGKQ